MSSGRKRAVAAAIVLATAILALVGAWLYPFIAEMDAIDRSLVFDRSYPTKQAAIDGGEMTRGWLPDFLPESSTDIHMRDVADQNDVWARITVNDLALADFMRDKQPASVSEVSLPRTPNQRGADQVFWWPPDLVWPRLVKSESYSYYHANAFATKPNDKVGAGAFIAVPKEGSCIFYWDDE